MSHISQLVPRYALWFVATIAVSSVVFSVTFVVTPIEPRGTSSSVFAIVSGRLIYAAFHWLLLSVLTAPILLAPFFAWALLVRVFPGMDRNQLSGTAMMVLLTGVTIWGRGWLLEHRSFLETSVALRDWNYVREWFALAWEWPCQGEHSRH